MADDDFSGLVIQDIWDTFPEKFREEFLARRVASLTGEYSGRQVPDSKRWEPLRPVVLEDRIYRHIESIVARLLHLAVDACRRRASTLGELHQVLRFPYELPIMDPGRPLVASELTRYARPDILVEQGRPRILELNNSTRLGGDTVTPRLAQNFAQICPQSGLRPPPSTVTARSAALVRMLGGTIGHAIPRRLLVPTYWTVDDTGTPQHHDNAKKAIVADAQRVGFEVVQADLAELRIDTAGRLLATDVPIDLVLLHRSKWSCTTDDGGGFAALRAAEQARTVQLFPRTESIMISSKAVFGWLHEDCDAGLLAPADCGLVRDYVPRTVCLGLNGDSVRRKTPLRIDSGERDGLIVKPAIGKSGNGVLFGSQASEQDWLAATVHAAQESPVVLQHRVEPDRVTMPFLDRHAGQLVTAQVPVVLSPFMIDGAAATVLVRHMGPDAPRNGVISASRGAHPNTVLLADNPGQPSPRDSGANRESYAANS
jgi:hypothetical protein